MNIDFLSHVRVESARFAEVLAYTDPSAPVPSCPGWNAADLLWHLAEVQFFWATVVRTRPAEPDPSANPERPATYADLLAMAGRASRELVDALSGTAADDHVWTWFAADQTAGFVRRRQAHEALIHRLDAELTSGTVTDFDPALATDGVAEVIVWMYGGAPPWATHELDGPVGRLATSDTGAQWLVQVGQWSGTSPNSGTTYSAEPSLTLLASGEPSFSISAPARDLDAWLWNRPSQSEIVREGDCTAFEAVIRTGVQ